MDQNRKRDTDIPTRSSQHGAGGRIAGDVGESGKDLGTSSDRAMFSERVSSNAGGITNRPLDREKSEQEQLPERGRSKSDPVMPSGRRDVEDENLDFVRRSCLPRPAVRTRRRTTPTLRNRECVSVSNAAPPDAAYT
jgi:hypothetical protein